MFLSICTSIAQVDLILLHVLKKVNENRSNSEMVAVGVQFLAIKSKLKVFHTRQMHRSFREKCSNLMKIPPGVADYIYKTDTGFSDSSTQRYVGENLSCFPW